MPEASQPRSRSVEPKATPPVTRTEMPTPKVVADRVRLVSGAARPLMETGLPAPSISSSLLAALAGKEPEVSQQEGARVWRRPNRQTFLRRRSPLQDPTQQAPPHPFQSRDRSQGSPENSFTALRTSPPFQFHAVDQIQPTTFAARLGIALFVDPRQFATVHTQEFPFIA
jgi:hypothetical protein